jgi:hypothetical protein
MSANIAVPIIALSIPIAAIVMRGLRHMADARVEEARIRAAGGDPGELAGLREEVDELRRELGEVQERLDFAERLLTRVRDTSSLPPDAPHA